MIWGEFLAELKSSDTLLTQDGFSLVLLPAHSKETLTIFPQALVFSQIFETSECSDGLN